MRGAQQRTETALGEQFGLGEEAEPAFAPIGDPGQCERVEIRDVIARDDRGTVGGNVLLAFDRPTQSVAQPGPEHRLRGGIHRVHDR